MLAGLGVVVGALAIWTVLSLTAPAEPIFEGKKISVWMKTVASTNRTESDPAFMAIRSLGSNAVPYMVHRLKREATKNYWLKKADHLLHTGQTFQHFNQSGISTVDKGLNAIGPAAVPALDQLIQESSNDEVIYESAIGTFNASAFGFSGNHQLPLGSNATAKAMVIMTKRALQDATAKGTTGGN